jgi:hypothetical protein
MNALWLSVPVAACAAAAHAQAQPTQALRGLEARVEADQTPSSSVIVRVSPGSADGRQRIEFIGNVAGEFDLRTYLEREDGRPLTDLASIPVSVVSKLPVDHGFDLYGTSGSWMNWRAHYREFMWGAVALWACVPVAVLGIRAMRRPRAAPAPAPAPPPPSVADQLRDALELAKTRRLTTDESGRLELLLLHYLGGENQGEGADLAQVLQNLRSHEATRPLVLAVERWLHAKSDGDSARVHAATALEELRRARFAGAGRAGVNA